MSYTPHTAARAIILAALVGGSALVVPTAASAQSAASERALLNRFVSAQGGSATASAHLAVAPIAEQRFIDGERALLNRAPLFHKPEGTQPIATDAAHPDGMKALLNRSSS